MIWMYGYPGGRPRECHDAGHPAHVGHPHTGAFGMFVRHDDDRPVGHSVHVNVPPGLTRLVEAGLRKADCEDVRPLGDRMAEVEATNRPLFGAAMMLSFVYENTLTKQDTTSVMEIEDALAMIEEAL